MRLPADIFINRLIQLRKTEFQHFFAPLSLTKFNGSVLIQNLTFYSAKTNNFFEVNQNKPVMGKKGRRGNATYIGTDPNKAKMKTAPAFINLATIGTGGPGTGTCLLLATEHTRYMFNCGEGAQRLILMDKRLRAAAFVKLSGVDNIFITRKSWDSIGGLLGLSMNRYTSETQSETVDSAKKGGPASQKVEADISPLFLYGPEGVQKLSTMTRQFAEQKYISLERKTGEFEDEAVTISPVILNSSDKKNEYLGYMPPSPKRKRKSLEYRVEHPSMSSARTNKVEEVYGYICKMKPPLSKINVEKCVDAGITLGPMVGQLQRGNSVTLEDGTVVHPSQVTDTPSHICRPFLVIDCPTEAYFSNLQDCPALSQFRQKNASDTSDTFCLVVHMTPADVLNTSKYRSWMEGFGTDTDHLIMNEDADPSDVPRIRSYQAHLNLVNADVFPLVPELKTACPGNKLFSDAETDLKSVMFARFGLVYTLRGKTLGFHMETDDLNVEALHDKITVPAVQQELEKLEAEVSSLSTKNVNLEAAEFPKLVFLGTGSSQPSTYRAQSFILIHASEDSSIIFDCGEDSFGQLFRFYGPHQIHDVLRKIKAIFISHLHGDHHMGLVTLLRERAKAFDVLGISYEPLILLVPIQLRRWIRFYQQEFYQISHLFRCFHHQNIEITDGDSSITMITKACVLKEVGLTEYSPIEVIHSKGAHGVSMVLKNGFKIVYSGDTRPCLGLAAAGKDCNLLIHEATHADSLLHLAEGSKHSTFSEAIDMGAKMNAEQVILTHFSQRYTHMVPFSKTVPSNVGIAFDNMQVSPKNMPLLSKFIPALTEIFDDKLEMKKARNKKS